MKISHKKLFIFALASACTTLLMSCAEHYSSNNSKHIIKEYSALWGEKGEEWTPQSRLPDFSFAGYHSGEKAIPDVTVVANVTDFGAKGDGVTDSTAAFNKAIQASENGAIFIPEGRYVITDIVNINKSNIVLRGAGVNKTTIVMPKSLESSSLNYPPYNSFVSAYSFIGGFIYAKGESNDKLLTTILAPAQRGDRQITLSKPIDIKAGKMVKLLMNNHKTLGQYLHAGLDAGISTAKDFDHYVDWVAKIVKVDENKITFDRPLRVDVKLEWQPTLYTYEPTVSDVGIENFTVEFSGEPKKKHLKEAGFNAIQFENVANSWIRNIDIIDADSGVFVIGSRFCQVENINFKSKKRQGITGHHAFWAAKKSQECLFQNFDISTSYLHDLTIDAFSHGNVMKNGKGLSINFDHHRNGAYENLFSNIDVGEPSRLFKSGGSKDKGPYAGVRETFWNITWQGNEIANVIDWPQINYIGKTSSPITKTPLWVEPVTSLLLPADLHQAQKDIRMK